VACAVAALAGDSAAGTLLGPPTSVRASGTAAAVVSAPLRIMPLGASSTVGIGSTATAGYRGPLRELLIQNGMEVDFVGSQRTGPRSLPDADHEGRSGWTLDRMAPHVAEWVRAARPDIVLLHAGTNDLVRGASAEVTADRLGTVLDAIYGESDAHVVVAGVWALLPDKTQARVEFEELARAVVQGFRDRGRSISYADTSDLLAKADFTDKLHANAAGYRLIAAMWERQILAYLAR
jgi:acyl-CoA thioesterase-1